MTLTTSLSPNGLFGKATSDRLAGCAENMLYGLLSTWVACRTYSRAGRKSSLLPSFNHSSA
jgi:hypothetical protein